MRDLIRRLAREESAQEIVEYAYAAMLLGLVGLLVWAAIVGLLGDRYEEYSDPDTGVQSLWEPDDPVAPAP